MKKRGVITAERKVGLHASADRLRAKAEKVGIVTGDSFEALFNRHGFITNKCRKVVAAAKRIQVGQTKIKGTTPLELKQYEGRAKKLILDMAYLGRYDIEIAK